jgi:hypothetical protein
MMIGSVVVVKVKFNFLLNHIPKVGMIGWIDGVGKSQIGNKKNAHKKRR